MGELTANARDPYVATLRFHASVPSMTFGHLTHTLTSNTVWDVRVGRFLYDQKNDPNSGDRTTPNRSDQATGISSGNAQRSVGWSSIASLRKPCSTTTRLPGSGAITRCALARSSSEVSTARRPSSPAAFDMSTTRASRFSRSPARLLLPGAIQHDGAVRERLSDLE